jgi:hypothetical protein
MKMLKASATYCVTIALMLSGCATTSGTNPIVSKSGFNNSKTVSIATHGNACSTIVCTGLGAQWDSSEPEKAILVVSIINEIKAITGAELNIDGAKQTLTPTLSVTSFESLGYIKSSSKGFVVSASTIDEIINAKRVWIRTHTPTGYMEDAVIDGGKDSKAFHALRRFMVEVKKGG